MPVIERHGGAILLDIAPLPASGLCRLLGSFSADFLTLLWICLLICSMHVFGRSRRTFFPFFCARTRFDHSFDFYYVITKCVAMKFTPHANAFISFFSSQLQTMTTPPTPTRLSHKASAPPCHHGCSSGAAGGQVRGTSTPKGESTSSTRLLLCYNVHCLFGSKWWGEKQLQRTLGFFFSNRNGYKIQTSLLLVMLQYNSLTFLELRVDCLSPSRHTSLQSCWETVQQSSRFLIGDSVPPLLHKSPELFCVCRSEKVYSTLHNRPEVLYG